MKVAYKEAKKEIRKNKGREEEDGGEEDTPRRKNQSWFNPRKDSSPGLKVPDYQLQDCHGLGTFKATESLTPRD